MWVKALWWKEYKQTKWLIWLFPVLHFLILGFQRLNTWVLDDDTYIQRALLRVTDTASAYNGGELENSVRMLLIILLVVLGCMLMGAERRNGYQEMAFALPYSRQQLFWTKWMLGLALIAASVIVNSVIDIAIVLNSPISEFFNFRYHLFQGVYTVFILMAVYSTVLLIGALCGSMASQMVFSIILAYLPVGISFLFKQFAEVHHIRYSYAYSGFRPFDTWMENISLLKYVFQDMEQNTLLPIGVPAVYLILSTMGGYLAYMHNKAENNGKLMLFPKAEIVLKIGFVVCASLTGAAFLSGIFRNELVSYYIGLFVSLVISAWLIRRLTRLRFKI